MQNHKNIYLSVKDYLVSGENFDLVYDSDIDFLKTYPQPNPEELSKYYESQDYISHTDEKRGLFSKLYQLVKKRSLQKKIKLIIEQNKEVGSLLDVGAGTGDFLKAAKEKGWQVYGMEPNKSAAKLAFEKGIELNSSLSELEGKQFDVVTLWHVLEHIPNLEKTILQLSNLVKTNGVLIIAVPNFKSFDANYYGKYWAAFDAPRHLWHFSKKSIKSLFSEYFELQQIRPMIFDSFYVSLLSEKYKTGNKFSLKGIWIGLISNLKAKSTKEYSSHMYCFRKTK
ncbi:class I SAM-dependent methyltransferase [Aequorivita antarctica]|uniref:Class I SAM-dependent methyltransferase n=1 Tax=Aequorivita antarctica TaxID=153266 RepID=A0A5C6Z3J9_9FLAO|nr:class I SAM-dependent methyltransferase [Aequorivita antarctica]TXD74755.1 class I SAM-dependent methyltransferase [Aequorivita antarctica]SRX72542.1 Ubiquinone biosynthesis O-methyltransferase [Aequorivita antarctica]